MYGLTYPQKRDFLETWGKAHAKNPEKVHPDDVETYLQMEVPSRPEFREKIYEDCRTYKKAKRIKLAKN